MPALTIDRHDLIKLLEGNAVQTPLNGLRVQVEEEVLNEIPEPLLKNFVDFLKG